MIYLFSDKYNFSYFKNLQTINRFYNLIVDQGLSVLQIISRKDGVDLEILWCRPYRINIGWVAGGGYLSIAVSGR